VWKDQQICCRWELIKKQMTEGQKFVVKKENCEIRSIYDIDWTVEICTLTFI
jgi:hypothetical protein